MNRFALLLVILLITSCSYIFESTDIYPKKVWSLAGFYKPTTRSVQDGIIYIRSRNIDSIDIKSGILTHTKCKDLKYVNNHSYISIENNNNTVRVIRYDNNREIWSISLNESIDVRLYVFDSNIYLLTNQKLSKVSFSDGGILWEANCDDVYKIIYTTNYLYMYNLLINEYTQIDNLTGNIFKYVINPLNNTPGLVNISGFIINDNLYYINHKYELIKFPNIFVEDYRRLIYTKYSSIFQLNNYLYITSYIKEPICVYSDLDEFSSPHNHSYSISTNKTQCRLIRYDLKKNNIVSLNDIVKENVSYSYIVNEIILVFTINEILAFDINLHLLWNLPLSQYINGSILKQSHVTWVNNDFIFIIQGDGYLSCFKIPKSQ